MHALRKQAQHARGVRGIGGLAEKLAIDDHHGIGAKHEVVGTQVRTLTGNRQRLLAGQALGAILRVLSGERVFGNIGRLNLKRNPRVAEEFLTSRRSGGEYEHGNHSRACMWVGRRLYSSASGSMEMFFSPWARFPQYFFTQAS